MRSIRWATLGLLLALTSCDVGTAILLMSKDTGGSDDAAPILATAPGPEFRTWVSFLPDNTAGDTARDALMESNGDPGPTWTEVGSALNTTEFDPPGDPATINTILTQVNVAQNYKLDSLEVLDDQGRVVEHATGAVWSNLVTSDTAILGSPDGAGAVTAAVEGTKAFIFTRYSGPIDRFRLSAQPAAGLPAPGDVVAIGGVPGAYGERPGGMAVANGLIHVTMTVFDEVWLVRYGLDGVYVDSVLIDNDIRTTLGSHSVAVRSDGEIFTASTIYHGRVLVRQFHPNLGPGWNRTLSSGRDDDRVEANGIAVDEAGNVVVSGAMNSTLGLNHWLAKLNGATGSVIFDFRPGGDPGETYWHAVTTGPGNLIYTAGDHTSGLLGVVQMLTGRFSATGAGEWEDSFGDNGNPGDCGKAVALSATGSLFVGGFLGTAAEGRNGILIRYGNTGVLSAATTFNGASNGDDEILDIALDAEGSIFVVGAVTEAGQGKNWWVRKYDASFVPLWTRTHDSGLGDDAAISVAIHGAHVFVTGYEQDPSGFTKHVLRIYAR